jgi:hypothetical protein
MRIAKVRATTKKQESTVSEGHGLTLSLQSLTAIKRIARFVDGS